MKKKHVSMLLTIFMVISCTTSSLISTANAIENEETFYQVEKLLDEKNSSVQINLHVEDNIEVDHVVMPDQTIVEDDLTQYVYSVEKNDSYQFIIFYKDATSEEVQELVIPVDVTEIVEEETVKPDTEELTTQLDTTSEKKQLENDSLDVVYVSPNGNDETGDGTEASPLATLAKAVSVANDGATVYLLDNLTINDSVRITNKSITIDGQGYTVKRGDIKQVQDNARSTYNPAMIEINNWNQNAEHHVLTLKNIVLDDDGKVAGSDYSQQSTDGTYNNGNKVQDAIIASYTTNDIVLGNGTVLKNYAGMSAVRITAGAKLIMEPGSKIVDSKTINRGHKSDSTAKTGQAGAVWIQGGVFEMNANSYIGSSDVQMIGRAVYIDSGTAKIGGLVQNINGSSDMWMGQDGIAIHLRNGGDATLTSTGQIQSITGSNGSTIWSQFCNFTADAGSQISKTNKIKLAYFDDLGKNYAHKILLNGTISECTSGTDCLFTSWYGLIELGETGVIENCSSSSSGGLLYSNNGTRYVISGTIQKNTASSGMIYIANQSGARPECTIESTAHIVDNTGLGIRVNNGALLTMNGGEIARNSSYGVKVSGKSDKKGVTFIMNGGTISDNGDYGIDYAIGGNSKVVLSKGSIFGNGKDAEIRVWNDFTDSENPYANNLNDHLSLASGVLSGKRSIKVEYGYDDFLGLVSLNRTLGTITLDEDYEQVGLAFAKHPDASKKIEELVEAQYPQWTVVGEDAYWIKTESNEYHLQVTRPDSAQKTGLYVVYIPVNEDGSISGDANFVALDEVNNQDVLDVTLHDLKPGQAYAFMFVNNGVYSLSPDNTTIYTGGGQGEETSDTGFPEYTLNYSLDDIETLEINKVDTGLKGEEALDKLKELLTITYTDENGEVVTNDMTAGEYTAKLSLNDKNTEIRINGNEVKIDEQGGLLIVRYTSNQEDAISGEITYPLVSTEPTEKLEHAVAIAKQPAYGSAKFYVNGDTNRQVTETSGISLLDDTLLVNDENDNRQKLMEDKVNTYLDIQDELGTLVHYDFHYLDLVDAFNGNAWVSASEGTTVYLPYPQGTDATTEFTLVHYKDLHREYGIHGQPEVEEAINNCQLETMNIEKTDVGIKFDVESSGFSPFVLVWTEKTGTSTATVNYLDKETNQSLLESEKIEVTIGGDYDVTDKTNMKVDGYHIDSIDGTLTGKMPQDGVVVTVYYQNDAPVIYAKDLLLEIGTTFDPLQGVTASDTEDGDLTNNIKIVENNVDTTNAGTYKVVYEVTDKGGKTTSLTINVTVLDKDSPQPPVDGGTDTGDNESTNTGDNGNVNTGDHSLIGMYSIILTVSMCAIAGLIYQKKQRQDRS